MKTPTPWTNNDVKPPSSWTPATRVQSQWADNITKNPAAYTPVAKNADSWAINSQGLQTYFYDDTNIPYNSAATTYNNLVRGNQLNQLNTTPWAAA
jgi:hypothetical protein